MLDLILDSLSTDSLLTTTLQNNSLENKDSTLINTNVEEEIRTHKELCIEESYSDIPSKGKVEFLNTNGSLYKENLINCDYKRHFTSFNEDVMLTISTLKNTLSERRYGDAQYYIYDKVIGWSKPEFLQRCDDFMRIIMDDDFEIETLLCVLMATYPLRKRLSYRSSLYEFAFSKASQSYGVLEVKQLFSGLE